MLEVRPKVVSEIMRRTLKKNMNLNSLKTGCSPCMNEAKKMQRKISDRNLSEVKIQEIKSIVSSLFKDK